MTITLGLLVTCIVAHPKFDESRPNLEHFLFAKPCDATYRGLFQCRRLSDCQIAHVFKLANQRIYSERVPDGWDAVQNATIYCLLIFDLRKEPFPVLTPDERRALRNRIVNDSHEGTDDTGPWPWMVTADHVWTVGPYLTYLIGQDFMTPDRVYHSFAIYQRRTFTAKDRFSDAKRH